jgi:site-specific recombinase XerD
MSHQITLSQAIEGALLAAGARRLSDNTIREYAHYYRKWQDFYRPIDPIFASIDHAQLETFMASLAGLSAKTCSNVRIALLSLYRWAVSFGLVDVNVARQLAPIRAETRAIHPFTKTDLQAMLYAVEKSRPYARPGKAICSHTTRQYLRNKAIIYLLLDTGLRSAELCDLLVRDADKKNLRLKVFGKGSKERIVPFSSSTALHLWRYLASRPDAGQGDYLFATATDRKLDNHNLYHALQMIGDRAGVVDVHPHRFRHTFAINFLRNGGNVYTLKEILGHASLKMCLRYLELAQADIEANYRPASPVKNWGL